MRLHPLLLLAALALALPPAAAQDAAVFSGLASVADFAPPAPALLDDGDSACPLGGAPCCGFRASFYAAMDAAGCGRVARAQLPLLAGNLSAFARNASNLGLFLEAACANAQCEGAKQAAAAAVATAALTAPGCVSAAAFAADLQLLCLRSDRGGPAHCARPARAVGHSAGWWPHRRLLYMYPSCLMMQ